MAARRHERTYARKQAIQALYQAEILELAPSALLADPARFIDGALPARYARALVEGVEERLDAVDALLGECSENWTVGRMPAMDRAILRLACYEMAYVREVPVAVAINEAVDLAKEYGGEDESPRFVNGVLGRVADLLEEEAAPAAGGADASRPAEGAPATGAPATGAAPAQGAPAADVPAMPVADAPAAADDDAPATDAPAASGAPGAPASAGEEGAR